MDFNPSNWLARASALRGWKYYGLCALLGAFGELGHAPYFIWPAALITFALLFCFLSSIEGGEKEEASSVKRSFWTGFSFGFGYFLAGIYWIGSAFIARGPEFISAMVPMVAALAAILALFWGLAGALFARFGRRGRAPFFTLAALFFLAEYARGHVLGGFPWALPGYIFKGGGAMSQSAALFGIYGLSLLVLYVAASLAKILKNPDEWTRPAMLAALLMAGNFAYGQYQLSRAENTFWPDITLRLVQVPFDQRDQMDPEKSIDIVNSFLRQTLEPGLEDVTHVIWPEGSVTGFAYDNAPLMEAMGQLLLSVDDTPPVWLLNGLRYELGLGVGVGAGAGGVPQGHVYNSSGAVVFDTFGQGQLVAYNDKKKLVPFGEFFPGGKVVERLGGKLLSTSLGSITSAKEKVLADFPGLPPLSPQICYEIIFSGLTPKTGPNGPPAFILNQSNDAWFGRSAGPYQHANIATFRAIETGLPIVRSASNGVSGIIDPFGRYLEKSDLQGRVVLDVSLPLKKERYRNLKNIYSVLVLINLVGAFIFCMRKDWDVGRFQ